LDHGIKYAFTVILTGIAIVTIIALVADFATSDFAKGSLSSVPTYESRFFRPVGLKIYVTDENGPSWATQRVQIRVDDSNTNKTIWLSPHGQRQLFYDGRTLIVPEYYHTHFGDKINLSTIQIWVIPEKPYRDKIVTFDPSHSGNIRYVEDCNYVGNQCEVVVELFVKLEKIPSITNETKKLVIITDTSKNITVKIINQGGSQINALLFVEIRNVVNGSYTNVEARYANYIEVKPYSDKIMDYNPPLQKGKEYWLAVFLRQSEEPYGLAYAEEHNEIFTVKP